MFHRKVLHKTIRPKFVVEVFHTTYWWKLFVQLFGESCSYNFFVKVFRTTFLSKFFVQVLPKTFPNKCPVKLPDTSLLHNFGLKLCSEFNQSLTSVVVLWYCHRSLHKLVLACVRRRTYRSRSKLQFEDGKLQASDTIVGKEHQSSSIRGKSRSSTLTLANVNGESMQKNSKSVRKNRASSRLAMNKGDECTFSLTISCSVLNGNWYISQVQETNKSQLCHCSHLQISPKHLITQKRLIKEEVRIEINSLIVSGASNIVVINHIRRKFSVLISSSLLQEMRNKMIKVLCTSCLYKLFVQVVSTSYSYKLCLQVVSTSCVRK